MRGSIRFSIQEPFLKLQTEAAIPVLGDYMRFTQDRPTFS